MAVRYEANPPKTGQVEDAGVALDKFVEKMRKISEVCGGLHITENVLGVPRISPILSGRRLRECIPDISMTISMRVRDKTVPEIDDFVGGSLDAGFSGMLVVAGDRSPDVPDSGQVPSSVVSRLRGNGVDSRMDLYLSVPAAPDYRKMARKIRARPKGFITQVVRTLSQVEGIAASLPEYHIIPILLFPSAKNHKAASFLNIDMSAYRDGFPQFIQRVHDTTGDVLITSPGDYAGVYEFLSQNRF